MLGSESVSRKVLFVDSLIQFEIFVVVVVALELVAVVDDVVEVDGIVAIDTDSLWFVVARGNQSLAELVRGVAGAIR